jgi:hypothetical protein
MLAGLCTIGERAVIAVLVGSLRRSCWLHRLCEMSDDDGAGIIAVATQPPGRNTSRPQQRFILALCKVGQPTQCSMMAEAEALGKLGRTGRVGNAADKKTGRNHITHAPASSHSPPPSAFVAVPKRPTRAPEEHRMWRTYPYPSGRRISRAPRMAL